MIKAPVAFDLDAAGDTVLQTADSMEKLVSLAKRRGFVFQSSEIYGGLNGFWDYGPIGVELRRNIKESWWRQMVYARDDIVGLDTSIVAHPRTWVASGHVDNFTDPMVDCKKCHRRFRTDDVQGTQCPECRGELTTARRFNLMFKTHVGAVEEDSSVAYLRPETCQSIFTQFKNVVVTSRQRIPFGIAQIGKSFRNEITPRNFIFRSREFEQMEMEFFVKGAESPQWYEYWVAERFNWFLSLGIENDKLRKRPHAQEELAHYARGCTDVEYQFPFGWSELEGIADRGDWDLSQHSKVSGKDLSYFDEETKEKFLPSVIETSVGLDRTFLVILADAYHEEMAPTGDGQQEERVVLRFHPKMAPFKAAVFPLSRKLSEPARRLEHDLRSQYATDFDDGGSIGKRYRRHDEIGTPFCVTYDFESVNDHKVTIRDRDSMKQERITMDQVGEFLKNKLKGLS